MGRKVSSVSRVRSESWKPTETDWCIVLVDCDFTCVGVFERGLSLNDALRKQERYNERPAYENTMATVTPTSYAHSIFDASDWSIGKHAENLSSFVRSQIAHRFHRIRNAEQHVRTLADVGAIARSLEDMAKGLNGEAEFLRGYDNLEASPEVLKNLGYEKA